MNQNLDEYTSVHKQTHACARSRSRSVPAEGIEDRKEIIDDNVGIQSLCDVTNGSSNSSPDLPAHIFGEQHVSVTKASVDEKKCINWHSFDVRGAYRAPCSGAERCDDGGYAAVAVTLTENERNTNMKVDRHRRCVTTGLQSRIRMRTHLNAHCMTPSPVESPAQALRE
jgi:hypothetical protein